MMGQAIVTKFLGPTDFRGSRVKATCQAGSVTVSWDSARDVESNHYLAALALAIKFDWPLKLTQEGTGRVRSRRLIGGGLPNGSGNAYVFTDWEEEM